MNVKVTATHKPRNKTEDLWLRVRTAGQLVKAAWGILFKPSVATWESDE